ncbi:MAG: hypothetical protein NT070_03550 [Cyanobacteria bacterium]|nr:hypothetical protein [Cyanobacteriota bacterium]
MSFRGLLGYRSWIGIDIQELPDLKIHTKNCEELLWWSSYGGSRRSLLVQLLDQRSGKIIGDRGFN